MILKLGAAMWQLRDSLSLLTIIALPDYRPAAARTAALAGERLAQVGQVTPF
jgi:hypothetical protein